MPSTHTRDRAAVCGDFPPPCLQRARGGKRNMPLGPPMASCSPVGGGGRLFPATPESESTAEMVEVPARMPAHSRVSTPSRGGREGIRTGVSHRPEANRRIASFCTIPIVEKEIIQLNHQPRLRDNFIAFSSRRTTRW